MPTNYQRAKKERRFSKEIVNGGAFNKINCQWMLFDSIKSGIIHFCTYVNHAIAVWCDINW